MKVLLIVKFEITRANKMSNKTLLYVKEKRQ